ncbi:MAG: PilN domain-containing protein [Anaerolineae bacterium]|nr:PilN domain-containing protein [Anaerolineae bacterium]
MISPTSTDPNTPAGQDPPRRSLQRAVILWLVAMALVTFFLPLYLISTAIRANNSHLEANLQSVRAELTRVYTSAPDVQELMTNLAQLQEAIARLEEAYPTVAAQHTDWPTIMSAIGRYDPKQIALISLTHADNRITLNGRAVNDAAVIAYARSLEESNLFSRVVVQSIQTIATPFATATSTTATPGATATPTATGSPPPTTFDIYETDDFQPKDIILGQPQSHNFNPIYDVDKVKFLAKAGRYYRVYTFDLAPGVDTFLTVSVAGTSYSNDDRQPGDLSSEVVFQATEDRDVEAVIKVTNRGQYGADMWYQITVEEVVPTPTPTPTETPTPTSTPTVTPTAIPTDTPTATPDLRDSYEPDDTEPKPIAVGETQTHNFYPDNDVDTMKFLAKAGRYYRVFSSNLTLGVDTTLTVTIEEDTYTNDDRQPGDLSSEVVFQAKADHDAEAVIKVTNRGQFSPDMWYQITVEEVLPTPTPTSTTTTSSARPPGLASLLPGSSGKGKSALTLDDSQSVQFVIVLELKTEAP